MVRCRASKFVPTYTEEYHEDLKKFEELERENRKKFTCAFCHNQGHVTHHVNDTSKSPNITYSCMVCFYRNYVSCDTCTGGTKYGILPDSGIVSRMVHPKQQMDEYNNSCILV